MTEITYKELIAIRNNLPNGAQTAIAKKCGLSCSTVSKVLNGSRPSTHKTTQNVIAAARCYKRKRHVPVKRTDLLNLLPWGAEKRIAETLKVASNTVYNVLHGKQSQITGVGKSIIAEATRIAKLKSTANE